MRTKCYALLLLAGIVSNSYGQSSVRVVIDSLPGTFGLNTTEKQLYLINSRGGNHYIADTTTGTLTVFAQTDTLSAQNPTQYMPLRTNFFRINNRYPVVTYSSAGGGGASGVVSIGMNGTDYSMFSDPNTAGVSGLVQFPADTTAWFIKSNKVFQTNLTNRTSLIDSGKAGSYVSSAVRPGHGGIYYLKTLASPAGGLDSTILMHHKSGAPRRIYTNSAQTKLFPVGMFGGDFYFLDFIGSAVATANRSVTIRKCNAAGTVTTVANLPTGGGSMDGYAGIGGGKLWFPVNGYNGLAARNFFACDLASGTIAAATPNSSRVMPFINNNSVSPDSFLYYRHLGSGFGAPDTLFRTKGTPASTQRYGLIPSSSFFDFFDTSSTIEYNSLHASFCDKYPVFTLSDTMYVGTDTGIVKTGLARSSYQLGMYEWAKIDKSYYLVYDRGNKKSLLKYSGCGVPQVQLSVSEEQYVFASVSAFPNPSKGRFQVTHPALNHEAKCRLISLDGKALPIRAATGAGVLEIDATGAPAGLYILQVQQGNETFRQRLQIL